MKYKAVIFDLYGTLIDNFTVTEYEQVLEEMSAVLQASPEEFSRRWRDTFYVRTDGSHRTREESVRHICREMNLKVTEAQIQKAADIRLEFTIRTMIPRPDTIPTIEEIRRRGYKVGLVSDCSPETPAAWPAAPLKNLFDVTIFSCEAGVKKPDPRIYLMATEALGVQPEDCLYVGDGSSFELTGAANVGMHPVLIRDPSEDVDTRYIDREENREVPKISYLREVLELLD